MLIKVHNFENLLVIKSLLWDLFYISVLIIATNFRLKVEKVGQKQISMENKGIAVFIVSLVFGILAFVRLLIDMLLSVYMSLSVQRTEKPWKFCSFSSSWLFLLSSCSIIIFILSIQICFMVHLHLELVLFHLPHSMRLRIATGLYFNF